MPMHRELDQGFFKKWFPAMAYVFGLFCADGNMLRNNRGAYFMEFTTIDQGFLEKIRAVMRSTHKIATRDRGVRGINYRLQIGSKQIYSDLLKLGATPRKSNTLKLPDVPGKYLSHFVRGYFDGDGNVYFRKHFAKDRGYMRWVFATRFTSGSKKFLVGLQNILNKQGLKKGAVVRKKGGYDLVFSRRDSLALCELMYNNVTDNLLLERKKKIFQRALKVLYGFKMRS